MQGLESHQPRAAYETAQSTRSPCRLEMVAVDGKAPSEATGKVAVQPCRLWTYGWRKGNGARRCQQLPRMTSRRAGLAKISMWRRESFEWVRTRSIRFGTAGGYGGHMIRVGVLCIAGLAPPCVSNRNGRRKAWAVWIHCTTPLGGHSWRGIDGHELRIHAAHEKNEHRCHAISGVAPAGFTRRMFRCLWHTSLGKPFRGEIWTQLSAYSEAIA